VANEAVCVGKAEMQSIAKGRHQAIVIEIVHHKLNKFQYGTTNGIGFNNTAFARKFSTTARSSLITDECL